ncbi:hypothetical protein BDD12DRAFT_370463 [Trichophaea hybrida]|nr:hypothetical protein BDD12DRAFT_370463 [Trichophaea hybrida]
MYMQCRHKLLHAFNHDELTALPHLQTTVSECFSDVNSVTLPTEKSTSRNTGLSRYPPFVRYRRLCRLCRWLYNIQYSLYSNRRLLEFTNEREWCEMERRSLSDWGSGPDGCLCAWREYAAKVIKQPTSANNQLNILAIAMHYIISGTSFSKAAAD